MDQALAVVVGAAIGSIGATGAAVVAAWTGRRQASIQAASQENQWRRQIRRDTYGALLRAGAEARDELGSLWGLVRDVGEANDPERFVSRLDEVKRLVDAVRLATATVFIEGPVSVLQPAGQVEESIVLFYTAMLGIIKPRNIESVAFCTAICSQQRVSARAALIDFAAAARTAIDGKPEKATVVSSATALATDSTQELSWLIEGLARVLGIPGTDIDPSRKIRDYGFDSLSTLELTNTLRGHGLHVPNFWLFDHMEHSLYEAANTLTTLRIDTN